MPRFNRNASFSPARRKVLLQGTSLAAAALIASIAGAPAFAHHGWASFNTRHAYFAAGTVTYVRWGNPHSEVHIRVEQTELPANWKERPLPQGANEKDGRATMQSARPYGGENKELHLVLAGPSWMERWGLDRQLRVGERIEAVGFLGTAESVQFRPVIFWLENGQGVWQQLTAFPDRPEAVTE